MIKKIKKVTKKIKTAVPVKIRSISLSLALFMMGRWLWNDTFSSIYIKEIIGNTWWVSVIWAILIAVKLIFVMPAGRLNDRTNAKHILFVWKILFVLCGLLFFFAWIYHSWLLLTIATIINWFANAITVTTYRSYYAKKSNKKDSSQILWIYFSATYVTEFIWSLIAAFLVKYLELPYMYFFVVIFSLVSLIQEQEINLNIFKRYNKTWKNFNNRLKKESRDLKQEIENREYIWEIFWNKWFLRLFFRECISRDSRIGIRQTLNKYGWNMYVALWSLMLTSMLHYSSYLFIPIVAAENNFSLSKIAIVFASMKLPYIVNIFTWKFWDKYSKKLLISIILVMLSFLYLALWFLDNFYMILILTFFISLWMAMLFPLSSALVNSYTHQSDKGSITWVQDFIWSVWSILWSLIFWTLSAIIWLQKWFMITWVCTFWLWGYLLIKKLVSYKSKNSEQEKIKSDEISELLVPASIDMIQWSIDNKKNN